MSQISATFPKLIGLDILKCDIVAVAGKWLNTILYVNDYRSAPKLIFERHPLNNSFCKT